jgi:hypothetical protein
MRTRVTAATKPLQFTEFPALYHFKSDSTDFIALMTSGTAGTVLQVSSSGYANRKIGDHVTDFSLYNNADGKGYWSKFDGELTLTNNDEFVS